MFDILQTQSIKIAGTKIPWLCTSSNSQDALLNLVNLHFNFRNVEVKMITESEIIPDSLANTLF